ncbi:9617_t:CDS:2, partial [Racocetra persica]
MPEVDDYFREVDINKWSYDGFLKFLTTEKCSEEIWISSLRAISKNKKYPEILPEFLYRNSASISSKHNKLQNSQESANGTRPDFTVQNYSNYEIFTLKVAGSLINKIQKKIKNDFAKLSKQMQNNINYIVSQEKEKGRSLPKNFQIFGASTKGFDIVIKRMISVDRYVIMQEIFTIKVLSSITNYCKLKILIIRVIALSEVIKDLLSCKEPTIKSQAKYFAAKYYLYRWYIKKDETKAFEFAIELANKKEYDYALNIFNQISKRKSSKLKDKASEMVKKYKGMS